MDENSNGTAIGLLVRRRRLELGLSLRDLEAIGGINRAGLSRIENGQKTAEPETLQTLSAALHLPLADLYEAVGYPLPQQPPSLRPYLRRHYGVSDANVDEIERYLQQVSPQSQLSEAPGDGEDELPE